MSGQRWGRFRYPHSYSWKLSAGRLEVTVYTVLSALVYICLVSWHLISRFKNKNIYAILDQRFKGYSCKLNMPLYKCKVTWNYAYSPFKNSSSFPVNWQQIWTIMEVKWLFCSSKSYFKFNILIGSSSILKFMYCRV